MLRITIFILMIIYSTNEAYIDPGSGSYLIQIIIAFLLGATFSLKNLWKKIYHYLKSLFKNRKK